MSIYQKEKGYVFTPQMLANLGANLRYFPSENWLFESGFGPMDMPCSCETIFWEFETLSPKNLFLQRKPRWCNKIYPLVVENQPCVG